MAVVGKENMAIIYEDNHLIAVNKVSGAIVQGDKTGDMPLSEIVKSYLKERYQKPGDVYLGVTHRLDRPVSGVVLFAKTSKALTRTNQLFRDRHMTKVYWAVVRERPPQSEGTLVHWLVKNEQKNVTKAFSVQRENALHAELSYRVLMEKDGYFLLEVSPITGRPHQIRVQLASMGCPIVGDNKYGYPRANRDRSICLHARSLSFVHPVKQEPIVLVAELPHDDFWKKFKFCC